MFSQQSRTAPVPVALFAYRRPEQLPRTLACLRDTGVEQLYVFSDGPADEDAVDDVERVREMVSSLEWIEPVTIARTENLGLSESIRSGLDQLFEGHDRVIVVEDDVCVAPEFYDYACRALAHYADAERVAGITGLRYPFDTRALDRYPFDVFLSPRFSSWSWATWKERWRGFSFDLELLRREIAAGAFRPQRAGADMPGMVDGAVLAGTLGGSWDVVCATNMLLHGQYFVTPAWNMVENTGLWSGTHFSAPPVWELRWEPERRPPDGRIRFAPEQESETVLRDYLRFFKPSRTQAVRDRVSIATKRLAR